MLKPLKPHPAQANPPVSPADMDVTEVIAISLADIKPGVSGI